MTLKARSRKKWWIIAGVAATLLVIGGCTSSLTSESGEKKNASSSATQQTTEAEQEEKSIKGGMYKIGTDMPAGEYVIIGSGYLQISSDSTGSLESIISNDNYNNRTIIAVTAGQYLKFSGEAYPFAEAPKVDISKGELPEGKYKVGVDFPAGEYKLFPSGSGYYAVTSTPDDGALNIISNDNFSTEVYISVTAGQYLKINRATLKL